MGLDITAYSHLEHVGKHTDDWCYHDNHVQAYAYNDFRRSFQGIPVLGIRPVGSDAFLEGGCYALTDATETHSFRAGSYSGYGRWRSDLRRQFNPDHEPDKPFYELIWFADNEGSIGPEAAADLLADFNAHVGLYAPGEHADYFREKYQDWTRACQLAADGGLIHFH